MRQFTASAALVATAIFWGSPIPLIGEISQRWDALTLGVLRFAMALPLVFVIASASLGWRLPPLRPEGVPLFRLLVLGGFGLCGFAIIYIVALFHMDPGTAAVIAAMSPVTSGLVALIYGERPSSRLLVAVFLSVAGALLAAVDLDSEASLFNFRGGEPLFLLAQALWAWYSIGCRRAMPQSSPPIVTFATMIWGGLSLFLVWLLMSALDQLPPWPEVVPVGDYYIIAFLSFGGAALAIVFWNLGVAGLGLIAAAMYMNLIPLIAVVTAYSLGIEPRWEQLVGGAIVITGVVYVQLGFVLSRRRLAN